MGDRENEDMGWDSLVFLSQSEKLGASSSSSMAAQTDFSPSYPLLMENENSFQILRFLSASKHPCVENEGISELVGSLVLPESAQISSNPGYPSICPINVAQGSYSQKRRTPSDDKRGIHGEKRPKIEDKAMGKGAEENSMSGETPKEDFVHVRARRGQATNSHSLAERVRREKISERMRLLQELVPGCDKITGKAVMLDEIINYVQSLQQQVEFLSMKLAAVYPELNIDFETILSKDISYQRMRNEAIVGFGSKFNTATQFRLTESGNELHRHLHVGFNHNSGFENLG